MRPSDATIRALYAVGINQAERLAAARPDLTSADVYRCMAELEEHAPGDSHNPARVMRRLQSGYPAAGMLDETSSLAHTADPA